MKTKKVNRYYCDFCKKSGCSGGAMKKHELHCTMNPNRVCGMCAMVKEEQPTITALLETLPDPQTLPQSTSDFVPSVNIDALRDVSKGCPACVFSALRQKGIPTWYTDFDWQKESEEFLDTYNNNNSREEEEW